MQVNTLYFVSQVLDGDGHFGPVPALRLSRQGTVQIEAHLSAHPWPALRSRSGTLGENRGCPRRTCP